MDSLLAFLRLQDTLGPYASRLLGAALIAGVAAIVATIVRRALERVVQRTRLADRIALPEAGSIVGTTGVAGVWLLALPALLGALGLDGLLVPVNAMVSRLLGFLPNLLGAVAVFAIGLLAARVLRQIVVGLLTAAGSEAWARRLGLTATLGDRSLAGLLGSVVFALLMLPVVIAALQPLGLDAVTQPISQMFERIVALVPVLASAAVILLLAALAGRALATLAAAAAGAAGLDRLPGRLGLPADLRIARRSPSELIGTAVMVAVLALGAIQAAEIIGLVALTRTLQALGAVAAQLAAALVVLVIGAWLASAAAQLVEASTAPRGPSLGLPVRVLILAFAVALALRQAGLPAEIVAIAFGAGVGAIAVAFAVAVGLGARPSAERLIEAAVARWAPAPAPPSSPIAPAASADTGPGFASEPRSTNDVPRA